MDYDVGASALEEMWQHCKTKDAMAWEERGATCNPFPLPLDPVALGVEP